MDLENKLYSLNNDIDTSSFYIYNIINNSDVIENEDIIFVKENQYATNLLSEYIDDKNGDGVSRSVIGKSVCINFYGTVKEINEYILSLNKYFNCPNNNLAFVKYEFYLPKKKDDVYYFVNINLKLY